MKRLVGALFLIFLLPLTVVSQSIQEGLRWMEVDKFDKAKKVFSDVYKKSPVAENAYYLGNLYYFLEKEDSASLYFNEGVKLDGGYPMNYVGLGRIAYPGNNQEGKRNFDKALELSKSKNPTVLTAIAAFYIHHDKLDVPAAFSLLDIALKYDSKNPETYILRGDGFWKIYDGSKAIAEYEKALQFNPKNPKALMKLGESYKNVKNFNRALDYYKKVLAIDTLYAPVYKEMGDSYYRNQQYDKAIESYKKYVSMADHNDDVDLKYAAFLIQNRDFTSALTLLKRMEDKENIHPATYRLLAYAYYEKDEHDKGLQNMEKFWLKMDKKEYISADYEYYGKLLAKAGKDSLAAINIETALEKDSSRMDLYADLGSLYFQLDKFEQSAQAYEKKVKRNGTTQDYFNLGRAYYYSKKYIEADTAFGTLIKAIPTYAHGYLWKAKVNSNLDPNSNKGLAKPHFEKFIELTKNDAEKNKRDLLTAYDYLGYYYLLKNDKVNAKNAYIKMKELDPSSKKAEDGLKIVNAK